MYKVTLSACGNIDHNENPYSNIINGEEVSAQEIECNSIRECQEAVLKYIDDNNLGSGNWTGGDVTKNNRVVGYISYNGRFWERTK